MKKDKMGKEKMKNRYIEYPKCSTCKKAKKWFNTTGLKYKELNLKEKLAQMSNEEKIQLLATDSMLIKRPIFITDKEIYIGFKEEEWKKEK